MSEASPARVLRQRNPQAASGTRAADSHLPAGEDADRAHGNAKGKPERRNSLPGFYSHAYLVHSGIRASPFDKQSPENNYRGFLNLGLLLLFVANVRLVLENYSKYGLLIDFGGFGAPTRDWLMAGLCLALMPVHLAAAVLIESRAAAEIAAKGQPIATAVVPTLHVLNIALEISIPTLVVWFGIYHPLPGMCALFLPTILFLKLISYCLVNRELRQELVDTTRRGQGIPVPKSPRPAEDPVKDSQEAALLETDAPPFDPNELPYPQNLTFGNALYFWLAPTLCYQPVYPRTRRFRKSYFAKRVLELVVVSLAILFLTRQYALPTLQNTRNAKTIGQLAERLLKLSMTSLYIWILGFYLTFHSFLNAFAEALRFGDRRFFGEWWNSTSYGQYWRLWNLPVSTWAKRHIYIPLIRNHALSPMASQLIVFTVSALLHELIIGVPTHVLYGYAALGMLAQVPMIYLDGAVAKIRDALGWRPPKEVSDTVGNLHFWMSFCIIGQPLAIMLFWFDWQRKMGKE
ncbi:MBOAT, membrane-bound O-acyltransferase family-domain-containing protein [Hyaloraphidium curvatum]|nr:MBOAT, membrane-bound O-acyltransferase family-domain-containing protein [Hyaloraphidium curvatum]